LDIAARVNAALRSGEAEKAKWAFEQFAAFPHRFLDALEVVRELGLEQVMLDCLLTPDAKTWSQLMLIGRIGNSLLGSVYFDRFADLVRQKASSIPFYRFNQFQYINTTISNRNVRLLLLELKYTGLPKTISKDNLFECAEILSKNIVFDQKALDHLFECRSQREMGRAEWEHEVRVSWALDHMLMDVRLPISKRLELMDSEAVKRLAEGFREPSADIVSYQHAGFYQFICVLPHTFPEAYVITGISPDIADGVILNGMRHALRGGMVGISPDGGLGKGAVEITVLGRKVLIKPGAAFMAYEAQARTSFFTTGREGRSFVPIVKFGPVREKRERYSAYLERHARFYESCLNDFFRGPPQNLVCNGRWMRTFAGRQVGGGN
jgi:hypothetical protein